MTSSLKPMLALAIILLFISQLALVASGPARGGDDPEPIPVFLNFNKGGNGELTPLSVEEDNVEKVIMFGNPAPIPAYLAGRWTTNDIKMPISIFGNFQCDLWAESQDGAKNAFFTVYVYKNSETVATYNTTKMDINPTPTRFEIVDILTVDLNVGDNLAVWVYFRADLIIKPGTILPQPSQATFLFGGGTYNSGISIVTLPIVVEIMEPDIVKTGGLISFSSKVREAFDVDPTKMVFNITVTAPKDSKVRTTSDVESTKTDDSVIFTFDWYYTKDKAKDGKYTVTMEVSYDGNFTFTNSSSFELDIPEKAVTDLSETPMDPMMVALVAIGVVVVALAIYLNRRGFFRRRGKGKGKAKATAKAKPKPTSKKASQKSKPPKKAPPEDDEDDEDD